ncbi:two-component system response regulator BtsR [Zophobihabitans entericus]|uniref:Two-component system response regulator BtsR n=1 Tax=Zophobihabitans entericus TaxID=1635327 RepID=A0A6G9ICH4_9GAMM|nr:two-component system response regulator BtsR [Zophobihabitans entericus]QIQ21519.1 two-component system response regulator BtsR [Zophobihabitans entericus]
MLNVIIVDDEPLARENLSCLLQQDSAITIVAECSNAIEGISAIHRLHPDVVFLDIQMPRINGIEMLSMIDPQYLPHIVFVTAYDEYAIKAFEEQAFDYLMKPIDPQRLNKTLQRLHIHHPPQDIHQLVPTNEPFKYIPCIGHSRIYLLNADEVYYVSSKVSGISVFNQTNTEYFSELTLRTLEERTSLIRCHRQYLINIKHLKEIRFNKEGQTEVILSNGVAVPVSRRYLKVLKELLGL